MTGEQQTVLQLSARGFRTLRKHRRLSLEQLVGTTKMSVSRLSRLESGHRRPMLEPSLTIARAHHIPLDELVASPASRDPRISPRPIQAMAPLARMAASRASVDWPEDTTRSSRLVKDRHVVQCRNAEVAAVSSGGS